MNYNEHIADYCDGYLSDADKANFENAMHNNKKLSTAVERYQAGKKIAEGLFEVEVLDTLRQLKEESQPETGDLPKRGVALKKWLMAASFLGIILYSWYWLSGNKTPDNAGLFAELYEEPIWKGERSTTADMLAEATSFYLNGDFEKAKRMLLDSVQNQKIARLWLSEMYLKNGQLDSTIFYLPAIDDLPAKKDRILYLNMIIAIKNGQLAQAKKYARQLPRREYEKVYDLLGL